MSSAATVDLAILEMLQATLPAHLRSRVGAEEVKQRVLEHLERFDEEKARFPSEPLFPWSNWIGYDEDWENAFFLFMLLQEDAVELFCGTGYWPGIRTFGEGEVHDIPAADLHREWAARFRVPCPPLALGRAVVKEWLGRDW